MPPTITAYNGPVATLYAGTPEFVANGSGSGGSVSNIADLAGLNGNKATFTQNLSANGTGPQYRVPFTAPANLQNARIRAWKPIARRMRVTAVGGTPTQSDPQFVVQPVNSALTAFGQAFGWHEFPVDGSTVESFTIQDEYSFGSIGSGQSVYADGFFLFAGGGSTGPGLNSLTFATWYGLLVSTSGSTSSLTSQSFELDTIQMDVAYTPADPGTTVRALTLNAEAVTTVTAAAMGIAVDSDWGPELIWNNPGNAQTQNTTFADSVIASDGITPTKASQTRFLQFRIDAGGVGDTTGLRGCELRVPMVATCSGTQDGLTGISSVPITPDQWSFASVAEVVIRNLDDVILAKLSDNDLYSLRTFKIPPSETTLTASQRVYDLCVQIGSLTQEQLADMNTRGFRVGVRFNLYAGLNTAVDDRPVSINVNSFSRTGDTPTISFVAASAQVRGRGLGDASSSTYRNRMSA